MAKFDLHDLLNERSREAAVERKKEPRRADGMEQLTLDVYDLIPSQENFYSTQYINDLKQSIAIVGLLQPLLVKQDGDIYRVTAGHRRRLACIALVEDGLEQFRRVPCVIQTGEAQQGTAETILDRLALIFANGFREKSDWEKMEESLQTEALITELRKEVNLEGRTRRILSEFTGITEAQLGRYKTIKKNLCPRLMQAFKGKRLGVSTACELSGLSPDYQEKAADQLEEMGVLSINDAKALKQAEEDKKPLEGQMELDAAAVEMQEPPQTAQNAAQDTPEAAGGKTTTATAAEAAQNERETPQDAPEAAPGDKGKQEDKPPQEAPQGPQTRPGADREPRGRGCAFCHPDYHREQGTAEGRFLLAYEPEEKVVMVMDKETGAVEHIIFHCCPFCGRKLK